MPPGRSRSTEALYLGVGVATFLLLAVAAVALVGATPLGAYPTVRAFREPPTGEDYFVAVNGGDCLEHRILFRGEKGTIPYVEAADVVFLGNSRLMYAFTQDQLGPFFRERGLSYYLLGFSHNEMLTLPREILRKFDLHPQMVVVNADRFFSDEESDVGRKALTESDFDYAKVHFEASATWTVQRLLHAYLPRLHFLLPPYYRDTVGLPVYRSRVDGSWKLTEANEPRFPIVKDPVSRPTEPTPSELSLALAFHDEIQRRGGQLVLTYIPWPKATRSQSEGLARALGVPLVAPDLVGLATFDHVHLNRPSASRFAAAFLEGLAEELDAHPLAPQASKPRQLRAAASGR